MSSQATPAKRGLGWIGQVLLYGVFAVLVGVFSRWPTYRPLPAGDALIKVSFVHSGKLLAECRRLTAEELARLPPNMRAPMKCGRERSPVTIEVDVDGAPMLRHIARPSGLSRDGVSSVYKSLALPAGEHRIAVRLKDSATAGSVAYTRDAIVTLKPAQVLVIDFDASKGGIILS
ncbi:MAG: hypothetical protein ABI364_06835 [Caldimonas sp.]